MKSTEQKIILVSFILAAIAAISIFVYLRSLKEPNEEVPMTKVLVAADVIPPRTLIERSMIKEIEVADNPIFENYIGEYSNIEGKYARETIQKNEGFHVDKLMDENKTELSLRVRTNHRAISIGVSGSTGVSYLIKPGDFVDIIVYFSEKTEDSEIVRYDSSKMVLQNIEVLALDKLLNRDDKNSNSENIPSQYLVTLSVPAVDAEKIVLADNIGNVTLALRPLKDDSTLEDTGVIWKEISIPTKTESTETEVNADSKDNNDEINSETYKSYTVKRGDTLVKISRAFYGNDENYKLIMEANNLKDKNMIITGQILKIPVLK